MIVNYYRNGCPAGSGLVPVLLQRYGWHCVLWTVALHVISKGIVVVVSVPIVVEARPVKIPMYGGIVHKKLSFCGKLQPSLAKFPFAADQEHNLMYGTTPIDIY